MKDNKIYIKNFYYCTNQVFNVSTSAEKNNEYKSKKHYDPVFGRSYMVGSPNNLKHCLRKTYYQILGIKDQEVLMQKILQPDGNNIEENQGGVSCVPNFIEPYSTIFGLYMSTSFNIKGETPKYLKMSLKSDVCLGEFKPLHPLLASTMKGGGVNNGTTNTSIILTCKKFANDKSPISLRYEDRKDIFKYIPEWNGKEINMGRNISNHIYKEETTTGIYSYDCWANMNVFGKVNKKTIEATGLGEDELEGLLKKHGWFTQIINNDEYLVPPIDIIKREWEAWVQANFEWDWQSNNSTHGSVKEFLRCVFSLNEPQLWAQSTLAEVNEDNKSAHIVVHDEFDEVKTFNSLALKQYLTTGRDDVKYDAYAHKNAYKELVELGYKCIEDAYPKPMSE